MAFSFSGQGFPDRGFRTGDGYLEPIGKAQPLSSRFYRLLVFPNSASFLARNS